MTVGGSQQLRLFRRAIRDGDTMMTACVKSGLSAAEARLHLNDDARNPPPPEAYELLLREERCELCADWRPQPDGLGECWSADRLDGDMNKGPAGWSEGSSGCEAWNSIPAPAGASPEKEDEMARPRKKDSPINGEVPKPDYALAVKLFREDIRPAMGTVGEGAQEMSTAYKAIKKQAHIQPQAARAAFRLIDMEAAKRDDYLRSFNGLLKELGIFMPSDLVDAAEGKGAVGESVVPAGERPRPKLVTIPAGPADDSDLNPPDEPVETASISDTANLDPDGEDEVPLEPDAVTEQQAAE